VRPQLLPVILPSIASLCLAADTSHVLRFSLLSVKDSDQMIGGDSRRASEDP